MTTPTSTTDPRQATSDAGPADDPMGVDAEIAAYVKKAEARNLADIPALSAFQRAIGQYPKLSPESQLELVDRIRAGTAAEAELETDTSPRRHRRLTRTAAEGKRAAEYLAGSNFRLVLLICQEKAQERYGPQWAAEVLPDLVGEANVALVEAINDYDPARCPVFSTYAARIVRDRVQFRLSQDSVVKIAPSWHRLKRIAAVRKPRLELELGREPTLDELRDDLLVQCREWAYNRLSADEQQLPDAEREHLMMAKLRKQGMLGALNSLADVLIAAQPVASLDAKMRSAEASGETQLSDYVSEPVSDDTFDSAELDALKKSLLAALEELDEREQGIIRMRYGMTVDGSYAKPCTYGQIGAEYNVTAERIRQIEGGILERLATSSSQRDRLAAFFPNLGVD